jgi:hypothetical protein
MNALPQFDLAILPKAVLALGYANVTPRPVLLPLMNAKVSLRIA